jgi:uncharacterized peroxidase-related enzyme
MSRLKSLPENATAYDVFSSNMAMFEPFAEACEQIMRGPSALTPGERELLGAYVSALNACPYCHDVHNEAVKAYGIHADMTRELVEDIGSSSLEEKLKPLFSLARKSTREAHKVTDADFEAAYRAGWDDGAIRDALVVSCLFNFMNRLISTLGIEAEPDYLAAAGERIRDEGYTGSLEKFSGADEKG